MIIGIDGNEANVSERVGVSWYVYHVLYELKSKAESLKSEGKKGELIIKVFLRERPREDLPEESSNFKYEIVSGKLLWSQIFLPLNLFLKHRDLNVFLSPAHYAPRFCPCPTVVVIHDVSYFYYPEEFLKKDLYQLDKWTEYSVKNASHIIAVSQTTKSDVVKNYGIPENKVAVVYNGFTLGNAKKSVKPEGVNEKAKYFLYVGTLQPRKNISLVILAFEKLLLTNSDCHLYIAGKKGWLFDELFDLVVRHHLDKNVHFLGYVSEEEKTWLLQNTVSLIAPGLYEGFGVPVLEGFASKVPVIVALAGALPEVGENACLYFDPLSSDSLKDKMEEVIHNPQKAKELISRGLELVKKYSWVKTANQILEVLKK